MSWPYFTSTPIYDRCALRFPQSGSIGEIEVPIHLTKLDTPTVNATVSLVSYGPVIEQTSNTAVGGQAVAYGVSEIPKIVMEGYMDTPLVTFISGISLYPDPALDPSPTLYPAPPGVVPGPGGAVTGNFTLPALTLNGDNATYAEIVAAYFEGRTATFNVGGNTFWQKIDPLWFRDPYGRVYNAPRILGYTASRLEAAPGRNNFTMILQLNSSTILTSPVIVPPVGELLPSSTLFPAGDVLPF